jgi:hypothetical protein
MGNVQTWRDRAGATSTTTAPREHSTALADVLFPRVRRAASASSIPARRSAGLSRRRSPAPGLGAHHLLGPHGAVEVVALHQAELDHGIAQGLAALVRVLGDLGGVVP